MISPSKLAPTKPSDKPQSPEPATAPPHWWPPGGDRDQLLDRLHRLRAILPVFAEELASARRQANRLRRENHELLEEVRLLRRQRGESVGDRR